MLIRHLRTLAMLLVCLASCPHISSADQLLIADRLSNSVYRYSPNGTLLGTVLTDNVNLIQPSGIAISPDRTKLYVASIGNSSVVQYDYDTSTGTASNGTIFAGPDQGLSFPSSIIFSQDGSRIYITNLNGFMAAVNQFNLDGSSAGAPLNGVIGGGSIFQYAGMAFAPTGELLVGGFNSFGTPVQLGAVARSDASISTISDFIAPSPSLEGTSSLLVLGNDLYVSSQFAGLVQKFDATTGAADALFSLDFGDMHPQGLIPALDGNGMLIGLLGPADGTGEIVRYGFDGTPLGVFATPRGEFDPISAGFREATAFIAVVPEPASLLLGSALGVIGLTVRRRFAG